MTSDGEHATGATPQSRSNQFVLLDGTSDQEWELLLAHMSRTAFRRGDLVIRRGEAGRTLYIVVSGTLAAGLPYEEGEITRPPIEAGTVLGEVSFFDGLPRSADVVALADGELLCFAYDDFERLAVTSPALACRLVVDLGCILSARLRRAEASTPR